MKNTSNIYGFGKKSRKKIKLTNNLCLNIVNNYIMYSYITKAI